jgi:hypothetical protein
MFQLEYVERDTGRIIEKGPKFENHKDASDEAARRDKERLEKFAKSQAAFPFGPRRIVGFTHSWRVREI